MLKPGALSRPHGEPMPRISYEEWVREIDKLLIAKIGLSSADGIDWPSRDCYDAGETPKEAIRSWAEFQDYPGLEDMLDDPEWENE
jgi:hypothetical protein